MCAMASQLISGSIVCSAVCSGGDQRNIDHVAGLCEGNPPVTSGFPSERVSKTENISI